MPEKPNRIYVVDALRGFAIVSILVLHSVQKFHANHSLQNLSPLMELVEKIIANLMIIIFSGKAYGIFALLFGLTFYIQFNNQEKKGNDFRLKFLWRLALLFGFGVINSVFFKGDIISIYAMIGLFLIPLIKWNNTLLLCVAIFLILNPLSMYRLFESVFYPGNELFINIEYPLDKNYLKEGTFLEVLKINLTEGKWNTLVGSWNNGRILRILGLFILGMLGGRLGVFESSKNNKKLWIKVFFIAILVYVPLFYLSRTINHYIMDPTIAENAIDIAFSWSDMAFTMILTSGFILLYYNNFFRRWLELFTPVGKMSLTNYIFQSVIGATIYYGYGFGLYKYTGMLTTLLIGILLSIAMWFFSVWWLKNNKRGPLEELWHKATWISFKKNKEINVSLKKAVN